MLAHDIILIMSPPQKYTVTDKNVMPWAKKYETVLDNLSKINAPTKKASKFSRKTYRRNTLAGHQAKRRKTGKNTRTTGTFDEIQVWLDKD